jgi:hypothetical protein
MISIRKAGRIMLRIDELGFRELVEKGLPLAELEKRLKPRGYSEVGFMGVDESLLNLIYEDWTVVEQSGTTHQEIAEALQEGIASRRVPNPQYEIRYPMISSGGFQDCPWNCKSNYKRGNGIHWIRKRAENEKYALDTMIWAIDKREHPSCSNPQHIIFSELHPHLIGEHYFFEGRESPYRADPRVLIEAFNLRNEPKKELK